MTAPSDLDPSVERTLRSHAEAIVSGAAVPGSVRDDLVEEILGHLAERTRAHIEVGLPEEAAAVRSIAEFGRVDDLALELRRTYHTRLWASTIGVLLASTNDRTWRPGIISWLRLLLATAALLEAVGLLLAVATQTPVRAAAALVLGVIVVGTFTLTYQGLGNGRRWALWAAIVVTVAMVGWGAWSVVEPVTPGTTTIPLGAMLAVGVLLRTQRQWTDLLVFTRPSKPIGRRLTIALVGSLLLAIAGPPALAAIPDPTQVGPADVSVRWTMTCDHGVVPFGDRIEADRQRLTLATEMSWRRTDLLPQGLAGLSQDMVGDTAGYQILRDATAPTESAWALVSNQNPIDALSGSSAGWFGAASPSQGLLPPGIRGRYTIAIQQSAIMAGRTIRASWLLTRSWPTDAAWPRIQVAYAHLDRFLLLATIGCGENVRAAAASFVPAATIP